MVTKQFKQLKKDKVFFQSAKAGDVENKYERAREMNVGAYWEGEKQITSYTPKRKIVSGGERVGNYIDFTNYQEKPKKELQERNILNQVRNPSLQERQRRFNKESARRRLAGTMAYREQGPVRSSMANTFGSVSGSLSRQGYNKKEIRAGLSNYRRAKQTQYKSKRVLDRASSSIFGM